MLLLRPPFIITIIIVFSTLCGYMLMNGLRHENAWSSTLALLAIGCLVYIVHLYHRLLTTPPDDAEMTDK